MTRQELYEKARLLPLTPGVYLMRNRAGTVIYVGKSKALRNRVSSYFAPYAQHYGKTEKMVSSVFDFEVYHTKTELEALLQENAFIKQYMPRYNIKLKEENAYPYIRVSSGAYPNLSLTYTRKSDKDLYFGLFSLIPLLLALTDRSILMFRKLSAVFFLLFLLFTDSQEILESFSHYLTVLRTEKKDIFWWFY